MIWYPYQQMKTMKPPYEIVDADGVYLYTEDNKMIDSISSWWSVEHSYKHPVLTEAIKNQADHFSHVMLGGLTHEPAQKLSKKLEQWLPGGYIGHAVTVANHNVYQQFAYERGVFSRPFLKYLYAMVPYIISESELVLVLDVMKEWFLQSGKRHQTAIKPS